MSKRLALISALVIGSAAFVTYQPGFKIGFLDGWWYLEWVGTMDLPRYLIQFLDPSNITQGYRPVQGLYVLIQYLLFHFNPDGYHFTHTLLHAANSIFLFVIVGRLGRRWRLALVAALIYAVSPVYSLAIFWHAVVDPLSAFFYLLTILLWTRFQEDLKFRWWAATYAAFILALFSKEVAVFLPLILFLIERWFYRRRPAWRVLIAEYTPMLALFIPFVLLELNVQSHGEFVSQFKFSIGPHMLGNLMPYLAVLAFPWISDLPTESWYFVWLAAVALALLAVMIYKRSWLLLFLVLTAVLNIAPLLGFPLDYFNTRYLYTSTMVSAILIALAVDVGWRRLGKNRSYSVLVAAAVAGVMLVSGARVADAAGTLAEFTRQLRVPFRDISRQHPTLPDDTYLYFVYSPTTPLVDFQGLFFVRYGAGVQVEGTETPKRPELRGHQAAYVYYFDESGSPIEIPVETEINSRVNPNLPASSNHSVTLESLQVPSTTVSPGKSLVVILDWSTAAPVDRDYVVFAQLVDAQGNTVAGYDSPPHRGEMPTSSWRRGLGFVDAVLVPVPSNAAVGQDNMLRLGMYDPATNERLLFGMTDQITVGPFRIVPQDAK